MCRCFFKFRVDRGVYVVGRCSFAIGGCSLAGHLMQLDAGLAVVGREDLSDWSVGWIVLAAGIDVASPEILQMVGSRDDFFSGDMA